MGRAGWSDAYPPIDGSTKPDESISRNVVFDTERTSSRVPASHRPVTIVDAAERLRQFDEAATQPVCSVCGQTISPEHVVSERANLRAHLKAAEEKVTESRSALEMVGANGNAWKQGSVAR